MPAALWGEKSRMAEEVSVRRHPLHGGRLVHMLLTVGAMLVPAGASAANPSAGVGPVVGRV
jgi:hypothetical protein